MGNPDRAPSFLNSWKAVAIDFSIEVEGIDVCHAGNVVEHGLYLAVERGGLHLVLGGDPLDQQLRIGFFREADGINHEVD